MLVAPWATFDNAISGSAHGNQTTWKGYLGYDFNQYLAVEGGYAHLGKSSNNYGSVASTHSNKSALFVAVKGTLPLSERFDLFGKIGPSYNMIDQSVTVLGTPIGTNDSKRMAVMYGVGAEFAATKQLGVRVEYEHFGKFGGNNSFSTRTSLWSTGVNYKF